MRPWYRFPFPAFSAIVCSTPFFGINHIPRELSRGLLAAPPGEHRPPPPAGGVHGRRCRRQSRPPAARPVAGYRSARVGPGQRRPANGWRSWAASYGLLGPELGPSVRAGSARFAARGNQPRGLFDTPLFAAGFVIRLLPRNPPIRLNGSAGSRHYSTLIWMKKTGGFLPGVTDSGSRRPWRTGCIPSRRPFPGPPGGPRGKGEALPGLHAGTGMAASPGTAENAPRTISVGWQSRLTNCFFWLNLMGKACRHGRSTSRIPLSKLKKMSFSRYILSSIS